MKIAVIVILAFVVALATASTRVHLERPHAIDVPEGWRIAHPAEGLHAIRLTFAIKQQNVHQLTELATRVSDPSCVHYGQYISLAEANQLVAPRTEDVSVLLEWLTSSGFANIALSSSGDFVSAEITVSHAQNVFETVFNTFKHESGATLVRTLGPYSVPAEIASTIDFIGGMTHFPKNVARVKKLSTAVNAGPVGDTTPQSIKSLYKIPSTLIGSASGNSQGVAQFLEQYYDPKDLAMFFEQEGLPEKYNKVAKVIGPNDPSNPGTEASLDIEYIMGVAVGVPTWFYYTAGEDAGQEPFLEWITSVNNDSTTPLVISVSYGDDEYTISRQYADRCDVEFQKFAVSGRTLLFASGDSGVGCKSCKRFVPSFPADSVWVTTVGATQPSGKGEVAADFGSGGGFSDYYSVPDYQKAAVENYFSVAEHLPEESFFNKTGRGIPDVSALGVDFDVVVGGETEPVDGTSCSSPTFAGVIALLNDLRLANGKPALGFLNPWIYSTFTKVPGSFNDITEGSNGDGCCKGFTASKGWDPLTGVGTPNYAVLKNNLPEYPVVPHKLVNKIKQNEHM